AAARRPDHGDELAFPDVEREILDRERLLLGHPVDEADPVDLDERRSLHHASPRTNPVRHRATLRPPRRTHTCMMRLIPLEIPATRSFAPHTNRNCKHCCR